jgi:AcrR family transcriptional regulator
MPQRKLDRRTERTLNALMSAFVAEVLARGYDAVSVGDIVGRANIGRSTFYMHYKSKDDLLRESIARPSSLLMAIVGGDVSVEMLVPQLMHFREQRARGSTFFREPIRRIWVKRLAELIEPRLAKVARVTHAQTAMPRPFIALQVAEAQIALISHWLLEWPSVTPEAVADAMITATHSLLRALLRLRPDAPILIPGEKLQVIKKSG